MNYLMIFIGGGLGSATRFFLSSGINQRFNTLFPVGTFSVNVTGSFLIGLLFQLFQGIIVPVEIRALTMIGFLGGFTTFSSFSLETVNLLKSGDNKYFIYNLVFTNIACLLSTIIGMYVAKFLVKSTG